MSDQISEADAKWQAWRAKPKFRHIIRELEGKLERESYVYSTLEGSVELWRTPSVMVYQNYYGGVEIHSASQLYDFAPEPSHTDCQYTPTGKCWHDGSSLAFDEYEEAFDCPAYIRLELADWHSSRFGSAAEGTS